MTQIFRSPGAAVALPGLRASDMSREPGGSKTPARAAILSGLLLAVLMAKAPVPAAADANTSRVVATGEMAVARAAHQATLLDSGQVLITGGCAGRCDSSLASAERYDPVTRAFRAAAPMAVARNSHVAVAFTDGRVLVAGGWSGREVMASAEIYDPAGERFTATGDMTETRAASRAVPLADGRILITGGQTAAFEVLASAEIFDPAISGFSAAGPMLSPRVGHAAVALADGRVLITGGRPSRRGEALRSAEIYDPATDRFQPTGDMAFPRQKHAAARLADGRVLIIGGSDGRDREGRYASTELYDPATGRFIPGPGMHRPRFKLPDAVVTQPSGAVIVAGGAAQSERYDPERRVFELVKGELSGPREFATATLLANGEVLVAGGYDERIRTSASAWLVIEPY